MPQTPFSFSRAPDPFLLLGDPGLINLPRNWLSVVMNISQCICKSSHQVEHLNLCNICQLYLNARGEIDFKETLNILKHFLWVKHIRKQGVDSFVLMGMMTIYDTIFFLFMHVWNFLLQKIQVISAENCNFSITYLSGVSSLSDNAIRKVWYQTSPYLQFSFTFPTFCSAVNTQLLVLRQKGRNWLLELEV